jgi:hypothetical protein
MVGTRHPQEKQSFFSKTSSEPLQRCQDRPVTFAGSGLLLLPFSPLLMIPEAYYTHLILARAAITAI